MCEGFIGFEFRVKNKVANFTSRFIQIYCLPLFCSRQRKIQENTPFQVSTHGIVMGIMLIMIIESLRTHELTYINLSTVYRLSHFCGCKTQRGVSTLPYIFVMLKIHRYRFNLASLTD